MPAHKTRRRWLLLSVILTAGSVVALGHCESAIQVCRCCFSLRSVSRLAFGVGALRAKLPPNVRWEMRSPLLDGQPPFNSAIHDEFYDTCKRSHHAWSNRVTSLSFVAWSVGGYNIVPANELAETYRDNGAFRRFLSDIDCDPEILSQALRETRYHYSKSRPAGAPTQVSLADQLLEKFWSSPEPAR